MKYILIQNDGEIESNSFELIGASTKRGESGKIGFFGSGLKYSIAYMMRNNIGFKVFSGNTELKFTTTPEYLKDKSFQRICINGKATSYTTTMGPTWTEDWFVLREIYCNALDEGSCTLVKDTDIIQPSEGNTRIFIELTNKLRQVVADWDSYFSEDREILFTSQNIYTSFLSHQENFQTLKVYSKTNGTAYRRGINVGSNKNFLYDYECDNIDINEDRTAKNLLALQYSFADMMAKFCDESWVKTVLSCSQETNLPMEYQVLHSCTGNCTYSKEWVRFSKENMLVVKEICGRYQEQIRCSKKEVLLIPSYFAKSLKRAIPEVSIYGLGNAIGNIFATDVPKTPKMEFLLKEVIRSLKEMKYEFDFNISVCEFENDHQLGQADIGNKTIMLSVKLFDMGRREIALTLIEEVEHIRSGYEDETRQFQTHIFSQWLKSMEDTASLFL